MPSVSCRCHGERRWGMQSPGCMLTLQGGDTPDGQTEGWYFLKALRAEGTGSMHCEGRNTDSRGDAHSVTSGHGTAPGVGVRATQTSRVLTAPAQMAVRVGTYSAHPCETQTQNVPAARSCGTRAPDLETPWPDSSLRPQCVNMWLGPQHADDRETQHEEVRG